MSLQGITSAVLAGTLVLATPACALETVVLPGFHGAAGSGFPGMASPTNAGLRYAQAPARKEAIGEARGEAQGEAQDESVGEALERREPDWLTDPPHPDRLNLWIPATEWAVALGLTIPLFLIDPAFVNTGKFSADHFADAWTDPPEWDGDGHIANYLLHPIMGAEAYLTARNREFSPMQSFLFATGVSFAWEYLFEAWVEQPSIQDLLVTSPLGAIQGELRFQMKRGLARWEPSFGRNALIILLDPIEAIHRCIGSDDEEEETMSSSMSFGPGQAKLQLTMQF